MSGPQRVSTHKYQNGRHWNNRTCPTGGVHAAQPGTPLFVLAGWAARLIVWCICASMCFARKASMHTQCARKGDAFIPWIQVWKSLKAQIKKKKFFTSFLHHTNYIHSFSWTFQHTPSRPVNCSSITVKLCSVLVTQTWSLPHFLSKRWILWNSGGHMQNYKADDLSLWCVNVARHCSVFVYIHSFIWHAQWRESVATQLSDISQIML